MAWAAILSAFTDRTDVVFGVTVSGRPDELSGVEGMVGLFINTVPLRVRLDPSSAVARQCLAAATRIRPTARPRLPEPHRAACARRARRAVRLAAGVRELSTRRTGRQRGVRPRRRGPAPAALESLSHFPVTIAAHPTHGRLTVLVETLDGALGMLDPTARAARARRRAAPAAVLGRPVARRRRHLDDEPTRPAADTVERRGGFHTAFTEIASQRTGFGRTELGRRRTHLPRTRRSRRPAGRRSRAARCPRRDAGADSPSPRTRLRRRDARAC